MSIFKKLIGLLGPFEPDAYPSWQIRCFKSVRNGDWYFNLVGANGERTMQSEGYTTKESLGRAIEQFVTQSKIGFVLIPPEGEPVDPCEPIIAVLEPTPPMSEPEPAPFVERRKQPRAPRTITVAKKVAKSIKLK